MDSRTSTPMKRFLRRSQAGQSLIILAIGFVALIGFVGIVTDISLLFVNYSTLRRAVDAAAVAAAGQMRRVEAPDQGESQAISYASMGLAARQFIEFYGLNPSEVLVETCHVRNVPLSPVVNDPALCTEDQRKLVRVTAQIDSGTAFFRLFGFDTIRLHASSVSETAVLDLVFIMDVSESMLNETGYDDWEAAGYGRRYLPPVLQFGHFSQAAETTAWAQLVGSSNQQIMANLNTLLATLVPTASERQVLQFNTSAPEPPNENCRVRFWPYSGFSARISDLDTVNQYMDDLGGWTQFKDWFQLSDSYTETGVRSGTQRVVWRGFVPQYDFYGCCNDPNSDWDMSDLICQPFRRARDASVDFMRRLDFIRGDRVAIVTFDRVATVIDPFTNDVNPDDPTQSDLRDAFMYDETTATQVMQQRVGVRTEDSSYVNADRVNPLWDGFVEYNRDLDETGIGYSELWTRAAGEIINQPSRSACPFDMALMPYPYSLYKDNNGGTLDTDWRWGVQFDPVTRLPRANPPVLLDEIDTLPAWATSATSLRSPLAATPPTFDTAYEFIDRLRRSYEFRASCAGTNIGDGLGRASAILGNLGRRQGAVWIMVLLSDGAAGASAPAYRSGTLTQRPNPFFANGDGTDPQPDVVNFNVQYGAFGLCPYGEDPSTGSGTYPTVRPYAGEVLQGDGFPYCSDMLPQTRNYCNDDAVVPVDERELPGPLRIDLADQPSCDKYYDVDDYARDWADFISVRDINVAQMGINGVYNDSDTLLPTIFTIGFGLEFDTTATNCPPNLTGNPVYDCNIQSYLGEELLRYIADAGDNFRIDNDYWQLQLGYRIPNRVADLGPGDTADWGPRGACERETGTRGVWAPLAPGESCGNYWAASADSSSELNEVFAEIAARMFTRIAG